MGGPYCRPVQDEAASACRSLGAIALAAVLGISLVGCGSATTSPGASGPASSAAPAGSAAPTTPAPTPAPIAYAVRAARADAYRQAQEELAAQPPSTFLWANDTKDLVRGAVATTAGPLDLTAPVWPWQPERLVVAQSP